MPNLLYSIKELLSCSAQQHAKHDYENVFLKSRKDIVKLIRCPLSEASILVLGCGCNYPDVILFSHISKYVAGIDIIGAFYKDGMIETFRDIGKKKSKLKALLKTAIQQLNYNKYYYHLEKISGIPITHQKYELLSYDGVAVPFKDETFDVVLSNAVLEHVDNPERLFQEVHRVTKKQGISYHLWHNYYSFYGGHIPVDVCLEHPWAHLRGKYEACGVNKLTPSDFEGIFSKYFDVMALYQADKNHQKKGIDSDFQFECEELLSESIRNELWAFPIELLLTRSYLIVGRKKDG